MEPLNRQQAAAVLDALWVMADRALGDGSFENLFVNKQFLEEVIQRLEGKIGKNS